MEALATTASIAGLLGLTGQCIDGLQKLHDLYQRIEDASHTVSVFIRDVRSLLRLLEDIRALLERVHARDTDDFDKSTCISLTLHLKDCDEDVGSWLATAQACRSIPGDGGRKALKSWFGKFWIAANDKAIKNIRADMLARRVELSVALSILGRVSDLQLTQATRKVAVEVHEARNYSETSHAAMLRLETTSRALSDEIGSMKSLLSALSSASSGSISSHPVRPLPQVAVWRCDAWQSYSGLIQFSSHFDQNACGFCGFQPGTEGGDGDFVTHFEKHSLTGCAHDVTPFLDLHGFYDHLVESHDAVLGPWNEVLDKSCHVDANAGWTLCKTYKQLLPSEVIESCSAQSMVESPIDDTKEASPDEEEIETDSMALLSSAWAANLLCDWTTTRDRINKWMLHMLGESSDQVSSHRQIFAARYGEPSKQGKAWARTILRHWSLDEAAIGVMEPKIFSDASKAIDSSLVMSAQKSALSENDQVPVEIAAASSLRSSDVSLTGRSCSNSMGSRGSSIGSLNGIMMRWNSPYGPWTSETNLAEPPPPLPRKITNILG